jgi:hypothetical protein
MGLQCVSEDNLLLPPVSLKGSPLTTCPFVLNGAPMSNRPTSLLSSGEYKRKPSAKKLAAEYYNDENYDTIALNTENIIDTETLGNTSLRYEGNSYKLSYIAIHKPIWKCKQSLQVSMVFTSPEFAILHICIPIEMANSDIGANAFLAHWLYDDQMPPGLTVNQLLNFSTATVAFTGLQYCLRYNNKANVSPYTFFNFDTPLYINSLRCPSWINLDSVTRKTSDEIFNLMMHGQVTYYERDITDPRLISKESHFSDERTQNSVKPVFYSVKREVMYKKKVITEGFSEKTLNNVKCYPINLNTQIDDNGHVIIDQATNKPIDLASVKSTAAIDPNLALNSANAATETNNSIRSWIVFIIIGSIAGIFIIIAIIYLLQAKSATASSPAAPVPAVPEVEYSETTTALRAAADAAKAAAIAATAASQTVSHAPLQGSMLATLTYPFINSQSQVGKLSLIDYSQKGPTYKAAHAINQAYLAEKKADAAEQANAAFSGIAAKAAKSAKKAADADKLALDAQIHARAKIARTAPSTAPALSTGAV